MSIKQLRELLGAGAKAEVWLAGDALVVELTGHTQRNGRTPQRLRLKVPLGGVDFEAIAHTRPEWSGDEFGGDDDVPF